MDKERLYDLMREKLGDYVELRMPHSIFVEFSNCVRDGVPTQIVFVDDVTGDLYAPDDLVSMAFFSSQDAN